MNREPSWTEAASMALEGSVAVWLSVPDIVQEIKRREIKNLTECSYSHACRSIRSALRFHSKKENGMFSRHEGDPHITYCLKKRLRCRNTPRAMPSTASAPLTSNGIPVSPTHSPTTKTPLPSHSLHTLTVEIDPPTSRPSRVFRRTSTSEQLGPFCLPSPLHSLLGPQRTLHLLESVVGGASHRPLRKVRQKRPEEDTATPNDTPEHTDTVPSLPEILRVEEDRPISVHRTDVAFVKTGCEGDPRTVQGAQFRVEFLEISPHSPSSLDSDSEGESGCESTPIPLQPTPLSQLLVRKSPLAQLISQTQPRRVQSTDSLHPSPLAPPPLPASVQPAEPSNKVAAPSPSKAVKKPDVSRQIANLFSPSSPLVSENLRLLLNQSAFESLPEAQKRTLLPLLPTVDQSSNSKTASSSNFSNSFFGSALREWHERLAGGAFTPEYRARQRQEGRRRGSVRTEDGWKQQFYEQYWGQRADEMVTPPPTPYYPIPEATLPPHHLSCLQAVREARTHLPPPPQPQALPPRASPPRTEPLKPPLPMRKNHILPKKRPPPVKPAKISRPKSVKRAGHTPPHRPLVKRISLAAFLTPLPPKTSYQSLLLALQQASRAPPAPSPSLFTPPTPHPHAVYHDHFALLSAEHVPVDFMDPVTSLPVCLPRELHTSCLQRKAAARDHNYSLGGAHRLSLPLSLPRALLVNSCVCEGEPLLYCPTCHSLYHAACSRLCPSCSV